VMFMRVGFMNVYMHMSINIHIYNQKFLIGMLSAYLHFLEK